MSVLKIQINRPIILNVIKIFLTRKTNLFVLGFQPANEHMVGYLTHHLVIKKKSLDS